MLIITTFPLYQLHHSYFLLNYGAQVDTLDAILHSDHSQIHGLIWVLRLKLIDYVAFLITSKVLDVRRRGAIEGNAADDALMVDQGHFSHFSSL